MARLRTFIMLDGKNRLTSHIVKRLQMPKTGRWYEVPEQGCCETTTTTTSTTSTSTSTSTSTTSSTTTTTTTTP